MASRRQPQLNAPSLQNRSNGSLNGGLQQQQQQQPRYVAMDAPYQPNSHQYPPGAMRKSQQYGSQQMLLPEHGSYQSPFSDRYRFASGSMVYNFSDYKRFFTWRRMWLYIAKAEKVRGDVASISLYV